MPRYSIDRSEVLRYLGYGGQAIDEQLSAKIDAGIQLCWKTARPRYLQRIFPYTDQALLLSAEGERLYLPGKSIQQHLQAATGCAVLCATLGMDVETRLRQLQSKDMAAALIFDAACDTLIESVVDFCQTELAEKIAQDGYQLGQRYSPGYGDLPLDIQAPLLAAVDATRRIGLTRTDSNLLLPRKSVTALAGIYPLERAVEIKQAQSSCADCQLYHTCAFRKGGKACAQRTKS